MVHVQKWDGKETSLVREVSGSALTLVSAQLKQIHTYMCACFHASVCISVVFELFFSLHHRHSQWEMSYAHVATRRQSKTTLSPLPSPTYISWSPPPPLTPITPTQSHTKQTHCKGVDSFNVPSSSMFSINVTVDCGPFPTATFSPCLSLYTVVHSTVRNTE